MKALINMGHGPKNIGYDPGAIGPTGYKEATQNKEVGELVASKLRANGWQIRTIHDGDLWDVTNEANKTTPFNPDYFLSIHANAFTNPTAHGIETHALAPGGKGEKIAREIQKELVSATGLYDRGVKFSNFHVLRVTDDPAVLVEIGFISNPKEEALMKLDSFDELVASAICRGFSKAVGVSYTEPRNKPPVDPPVTSETQKHLVMGEAEVTIEQAEMYLHKINSKAPFLAQIYKEEAETEGVRWDILFAQSIKETNYFTFSGDARPEWNNYGGIGVTGRNYIPSTATEKQFVEGVIEIKDKLGGDVGVKFGTPRLGIRCQVQHVKAYSSTDALTSPCIDPRFRYVRRGVAPYIEDYGSGVWASDRNNYGGRIWEIVELMKSTIAVPVKPDKTAQAIALMEQALLILKGND